MSANRPADRGRGRRTLAWMAGLFVAAQLVGGLLLDYVVPQVRFPAAYERLRWLRELGRHPDILCLGSSRLQGFVSDSELTHELREHTGQRNLCAFNAAIEGGDFLVQEFLLRRILAQGVRPRLLLLEISPETLNAYNEFYRLHVFRQLRWEDLPDHGRDVLVTVPVGQWLAARLLPLYRHRYQIVKQCWTSFAPPPPPFALGPRYPMTEATLTDLLTTSRPLSERQKAGLYGETRPDRPYLKNYRLGGTVAQALERILERCREEGITPLLVGAPVASVYRARYTPAIQKQYETFLARLRREYGVRYVECRAAVPDHLFGDTHHALSGEGAIVFSRLLAREVLAPFLRSGGESLPARAVGWVGTEP